jgi:hypothetical protein
MPPAFRFAVAARMFIRKDGKGALGLMTQLIEVMSHYGQIGGRDQ